MVHEIVGRINGQFGTLTYVPIYHLDTSLSFTELCALYAGEAGSQSTAAAQSHVLRPARSCPVSCQDLVIRASFVRYWGV